MHVLRSESRQIGPTDKALGRPIGMIPPNLVGDRVTNECPGDDIAGGEGLAANRTTTPMIPALGHADTLVWDDTVERKKRNPSPLFVRNSTPPLSFPEWSSHLKVYFANKEIASQIIPYRSPYPIRPRQALLVLKWSQV